MSRSNDLGQVRGCQDGGRRTSNGQQSIAGKPHPMVILHHNYFLRFFLVAELILNASIAAVVVMTDPVSVYLIIFL